MNDQTTKNKQKKQLDPLQVQFRAKRLRKNQNYFAGVFKRKQQHVSAAFNGRAPELLAKINKHLDILESKSNAN